VRAHTTDVGTPLDEKRKDTVGLCIDGVVQRNRAIELIVRICTHCQSMGHSLKRLCISEISSKVKGFVKVYAIKARANHKYGAYQYHQ